MGAFAAPSAALTDAVCSAQSDLKQAPKVRLTADISLEEKSKGLYNNSKDI